MTLPNLLDSLDSRGETEWGVCLSVSSVALSCVAMGDVEADVVDELRGKLKALFSSMHAERRLFARCIECGSGHVLCFSHDGGKLG